VHPVGGKRGTTFPIADLRSRQVASIRPKGNADAAQQTKSVRVSERTQRAGNLVWRLVHWLRFASTNGAARLIHPAMHDGLISRIRRERALFAQPKPHLQLLQSKLALSGTSGLISVAGDSWPG